MSTIKLDKFGEYAYNESKDVITSLELERIMNAAGPTEGTPGAAFRWQSIPRRSCSSSAWAAADADGRGKPYCSKICCMYTAKHAMLIRDKYPDTNVHGVLYRRPDAR